ncbi:helix-turn-helix transcriptional regulator [Phormidium sp. LEGE 05292]|uniref:helix-turn-helix domain-containing protein n=1 Tax=[Phormidium] sp. LEGE 05292 TaxID=767427 RepID=UPI0018822417|nr:helix-turn-helix transcriptional regulator [Phormidium sp. LEGE 05292]MBE9224093.1 helix-turn-helix transcriptional regulator [Phormidium sp. LEGE 05292]
MPGTDNRIDTNRQVGTSEQLQIAGKTVPQNDRSSQPQRRGRYRSISRPPTSPNLFPDGQTNCMASNRLIWEGCNILTQGQNLSWLNTEKGSPYYQSPVAKGQGYISFWVTDDLHTKPPAVLEGEAALALIEQFDIRAGCLHLIYAAYATQLDRPWEQQFVLSDVQLERYLGLNHNKKLNKQEKLRSLLELAKQPCHLLVYASWPEKGAVGAFSVSRTYLWEIAEPILHYQDCFYDERGNPIGEKTLIGFTLKIRCGNWAQYFLNKEKRTSRAGYYEFGILSQGLLHDLMSIWHNHPGAARLMTWLLFKTKVNPGSPLIVETLMKVAFGEELVTAAITSSKERKKLVRRWEITLRVLLEKGWSIQPDSETYPPQYWPELFNSSPFTSIPDDPEEAASFWALDATVDEGTRLTDITKRTRASFEQLLAGRLWVRSPAEIAQKLDEITKHKKSNRKKPLSQKTNKRSEQTNTGLEPEQSLNFSMLTGEEVRRLRTEKGLSVTKLAELAGLAKSMVSMIETGKRPITAQTQKRLTQALEINH